MRKNDSRLYRVVTHDRTDQSGNQWSDYFVEAYEAESDPHNSLLGAVVSTDFKTEIEAQKYADNAYSERKRLLENHLRG